ncbi:type IV pili methyl-accepting chemotaxis transducer N-terminal domain-containing protein [Actibacterium sp. 188UL27-1]|uniref:type IV pili methyl-accepting chemotaxis transducer N-terminal domain-containing protein n=1 Tax=Actibacterium sp. 188UL27-1 TaxID=2786961 RepID=UPI001958CD6A|nr:type IV pili methyl-accepting chemotaxis transducer N-terminal domain-containing protein [Actibacterium sp. 188UL27-1]MBM7067985.1 type IV pili methyl-accepting chemotaxis transducer N-terminal domain-containing protein [Actibacterium sp. 188UL27-1]
MTPPTKSKTWLPSTTRAAKSMALLSAAAISFAAHVHADPSGGDAIVKTRQIADVGASERINLSGKLRMLSQRIPAATCNLSIGYQADVAHQMLSNATAEFAKITNALEFGDPDLNINGAEERRKTLAALEALHGTWDPIHIAIMAVLDGDHGHDRINEILSRNMDLLAKAKLLVSEISGEYSNPAEMTQADALLVDISGRQRMLTQKMAKEACLVYSGRGTSDTAQDLANTLQTFDISLTALTNGLPDAGILAAPTSEIKEGLDVVWASWIPIKQNLEKLIAGEKISEAEKSDIFLRLNIALRDMNTVVGMYSNHAKRML